MTFDGDVPPEASYSHVSFQLPMSISHPATSDLEPLWASHTVWPAIPLEMLIKQHRLVREKAGQAKTQAPSYQKGDFRFVVRFALTDSYDPASYM